MKVHVDSSACQGHGRCCTLSPEVFDLDIFGYAVVRADGIGPDTEVSVRDAVASCPERALRLEDD